MNLRFKLFFAAALFALGVGSVAAQSRDTSWYVGVGVGQTKVVDFCPGPVPAGDSCDDKDFAGKVFGGYQFNSILGMELGYTDLGKATFSTAGVGAGSFKSKVFETVLVVTIPLGEANALYGKWGAIRWDVDSTVGAASASATGSDITYGIGWKTNFTKNLAVRLEWQRYLDVGTANVTGMFDVDYYGVGLVIKF